LLLLLLQTTFRICWSRFWVISYRPAFYLSGLLY
jgi:hypothetical protein